MPESLYRPPTQYRYATPSGEMEPTDVRARAVGNAVYVEHVGGCGDIFAWGARDGLILPIVALVLVRLAEAAAAL